MFKLLLCSQVCSTVIDFNRSTEVTWRWFFVLHFSPLNNVLNSFNYDKYSRLLLEKFKKWQRYREVLMTSSILLKGAFLTSFMVWNLKAEKP